MAVLAPAFRQKMNLDVAAKRPAAYANLGVAEIGPFALIPAPCLDDLEFLAGLRLQTVVHEQAIEPDTLRQPLVCARDRSGLVRAGRLANAERDQPRGDFLTIRAEGLIGNRHTRRPGEPDGHSGVARHARDCPDPHGNTLERS